MHMTSSHLNPSRCFVTLIALLPLLITTLPRASAQESAPLDRKGSATLRGHVRNEHGDLAANAIVSLSVRSAGTPASRVVYVTHTDSVGVYEFLAIVSGDYILAANLSGYPPAISDWVHVGERETKTIDFALRAESDSEAKATGRQGSGKSSPVASSPEFFDEPQFTVAGVTQAANSGGHGSDIVLRTTESLAKATVSLEKEATINSNAPAANETQLRQAVEREPENCDANWQLGTLLAANGRAAEAIPYLQKASLLKPSDPEIHHSLARLQEMAGDSLQAVREYQRAAEIDPSERNLFDWGTDLLYHRALEPASEVFAKGTRLYPKSVSLLIALGVSWYAREFYDKAAQCLSNASDLDPNNPSPYLFLGRMQRVGTFPTDGVTERLARFQHLQPENALANYYYAASLWKRSSSASGNGANNGRVEQLLRDAVRLDPKLGEAYLQLGIVYARQQHFPLAISAYQKAISVSPEVDDILEEAHYRLGLAYQRTGDKNRAQQELELHQQITLNNKKKISMQRKQIQEFVVSLRSQNSVSQP